MVICIIDLPRIYERGPPPRILINDKILKLTRVSSSNKNLAYKILYKLYVTKQFSQSKIAKLFGVQHQTVARWLTRLNIPIRNRYDTVSFSLSKFKTIPFNGNLEEKAYLIGLRAGDLHAQKHGRKIRVSIGTTHPHMLHLFDSAFSKYSKVGVYPKFDKLVGYKWCHYCDLDKSFEFILEKINEIPEWIKKEKLLFLSFLAGYFDAEGCISISFRKNYGSVSWIIKSYDKPILDEIMETLNRLGFQIKHNLAKKADKVSYNEDYWYIGTGRVRDVMKLLAMIKIKHPEKLMKINLANELIKSNWKDAGQKIVKLRNRIKSQVRKCQYEARLEYLKHKR